jgi:hypothetical protein
LLGAGASVMSGIPSADDLADQIARHGYCLAHNLTFGDPSVERSDWVQWLGVLPWYEDGLPLERRYPLFVEKLLQPREERKRFFQQAIRTTKVMPAEVTTDQAPVYPAVLEELVPAAWHRTDRYANNRIEADHGRLNARLRPIRRLKQDRSVSVIIAGHAFIQNVRRGHYELVVEEPANRRVAVAVDELAVVI